MLAQKDKPDVLSSVAKTEKGHGVSLVANKDGWHGKALSADQAKTAIAELGGERLIVIKTAKAGRPPTGRREVGGAAQAPHLCPGKQRSECARLMAMRLAALGATRLDMVCLDAEVSNSTHADEFKKAFPECFFEMFIAEQQMLGAAVGLAVLGKRAFASTFAAFFTRAYDQIRMAAKFPMPRFISPARTLASASARMVLRRWRSKTWR